MTGPADEPVKLGVHLDDQGRTWLLIRRGTELMRLTESDCERISRWSQRRQDYLRSLRRCDRAFTRRDRLRDLVRWVLRKPRPSDDVASPTNMPRRWK